jgi:non-canonical purine NTP pyrophosphatase (RdgB/HAM1 family)
VISAVDFEKLPLVIKGESKEVRYAGNGKVWIRYLPTIYSFTQNRSGVVPGSEILRLRAMKQLLEVLRRAGIRHAYHDVGDFVFSDLVMPHDVEFEKYGLPRFVPLDFTPTIFAPPIEIIVKRFHTGTSKHRYVGMSGSRVRPSHPLFAGLPIESDDAYPSCVVRFDWRNPLMTKDGRRVADEILPERIADWYIDVAKATRTAKRIFAALQQFMSPRDIVVYDVCLFIAEDGETVYGEITQDCGRYRHYELGHLDKDVWRAGGSSDEVLAKWQLLSEMLERDVPSPTHRLSEGHMRFFIGTTNPYKVREIADILEPTGCELAARDLEDVEETADTFRGNARIKAQAYAKATGGITICEDSGLVVPALGGEPGAFSARYTGPANGRTRDEIDRDNTARVLEKMKGIAQPRRAASFVVALVVAAPDGTILFESESSAHGWLSEEERGAKGFGYDAIFVGQDTGGSTYAELDGARKNLRSHRRRVLEDFTAWLARLLRTQSERTIVVDGNDGTGKSTLAADLRALGFTVKDRGVPTKMTDDPSVKGVPNEIYLVLDAPIEVCQARLRQAGKSLEEKYHTKEDLEHYRARFADVVKKLANAHAIDAAGTREAVLGAALRALVG